LPEGSVEAAAATLSGAFPQISGVIDSVMSQQETAEGDGKKPEPTTEAEADRDGQAAQMAAAEMTEVPEAEGES
ncbi:MAG: hypothetical protein ACOC7J_01790, partial [Armatimonadota bacterium]